MTWQFFGQKKKKKRKNKMKEKKNPFRDIQMSP